MTSMGVQPPDLKVGGPEIPVNLGEAFSRGANGVSAPGQVSFDGRPQPTDAVTGSANVIAPERIDAAVAKIANFVQGLGRSLAITVDDRSGDFIVQVQNAQTKEVIRQIPSEEMMKIAAAVEDRNDALRLMGERGAGGLLLDVTV